MRTPNGRLFSYATWPRRVALLLLPALLCACATAVVLKQDTRAVSEATKATVFEARSFYARLGERRLDYLVAVVATGKNCRYGFPVVLLPDDTQVYGWRCLTAEESKLRQLCTGGATEPACQTEMAKQLVTAAQFELGGVRQSSALAVIDALADYQILMAKIVADPEFDAKAELMALQTRASNLRGALNALVGDESAPFDFAKEIGALGTVIDLINQVNEDRRDLASLRALMMEHGAKFESDLDSLALRYEYLDAPTVIVLDEMQLSREIERLNARLPQLDEASRIKAIRAQASAELALDARKTAPKPLAQAFRAIRISHATLREAVVNGNLTEDQRRRQSEIALQQLKAWFDAIRSLVVLL